MRPMAGPIAWALISLALCITTAPPIFANVADVPIVPVVVSSSHIYADTITNRVDLNSGNITLQWKNSRGVLAENDHIRLTFPAWKDEMYYVFSADSNRCNSSDTGYTPVPGWTVWHAPGPNGTYTIGMNTSYASSCRASFIMYLTNSPKTLQIGNFSVPINPAEAKLSFHLNCPWRENLAFFTNGAVPTSGGGPSPFLIGRRHTMAAWIEFKLSNFLSSAPIISGIPFFQTLNVSWTGFTGNRCTNTNDRAFDSNGALPPRLLPSDFDYQQTAGFYYSTPDIRTGIFFLGWAISDSKYITEVRAMPDARNVRANIADLTISAPFDVQMLIQDDCIYDPTLELLFLNQDSEPAVTAGLSPLEIQAVQTEASHIAVIVSVVVVVVVLSLVAALGIVIYMRRARDAQQANDLKDKLGKYTQDDYSPRTQSNESSPASPAPATTTRPSSSKSGKWHSGSTRHASVSNTFDN